MKAVALALTLLLCARSALADNPPPCDKTDSECLVRSALAWKYKADALTEENKLLRNQVAELEHSPTPKILVICVLAGAVFFGSFYTASKVIR